MGKIITKKVLISIREKLKVEHKKVVFTNGCFDFIHSGHIHYLKEARSFGDTLVVGVNSDNSIRRIKGNSRPINNQDARALVLSSLEMVDYVVLFDEDTPYEIIKLVQPDVLVKGSDYKAQNIVGSDIVRAKGGKVETIEFLPGYSTTAIEEKIREEGS